MYLAKLDILYLAKLDIVYPEKLDILYPAKLRARYISGKFISDAPLHKIRKGNNLSKHCEPDKF